MTDTASDLARIAAALERLSPAPPHPADPAVHAAYVWRGETLAEARGFDPLPIAQLIGIEPQKQLVLDNALRLAAGHAAHDVLLWGARGMGKSALVKSVVAAVRAGGGDLALIDVAADRIATLPALFAAIANVPRAYIVFVDDLGFEDNGSEARLLRSLLEGGAEARPPNARVHVTSNRRHIVPRGHDEQASAINPRDVAEDRLALADRFGLSLGFHMCDQDRYLAMVESYAAAHGLAYDPAEALLWAQQRGARSGRVAWHYASELAGRAGKRL